jgi:hypothetical protein
MSNILIVLFSILTVIGRCLITPRLILPTAEGGYESFAHLFVGGLFGAWIVKWDWRWWPGWIAVGLSLFELVMFMIQKHLAG